MASLTVETSIEPLREGDEKEDCLPCGGITKAWSLLKVHRVALKADAMSESLLDISNSNVGDKVFGTTTRLRCIARSPNFDNLYRDATSTSIWDCLVQPTILTL